MNASTFVCNSDINIANSYRCASANQEEAKNSGTYSVNSADNKEDSDEACRCNYLAFSEPQFEAEVVRKRMCNGSKQPMEYIGYTRSLLVHFEFGFADSMDSFNVSFESESRFIMSCLKKKYLKNECIGNLDVVKGIPIDEHDLAKVTHQPGAVIGSPYFPTLCSRDLIKQHMIRCEADDSKIDDKNGCIIRILFTDFQIGKMSRMEVNLCYYYIDFAI